MKHESREHYEAYRRRVMHQRFGLFGLLPSWPVLLGSLLVPDARRWARRRLSHGGRATLALGAFKSTVAHLEGAAGLASMLKLVLTFEQSTAMSCVHFHRLNPYIDDDPVFVRATTAIPT